MADKPKKGDTIPVEVQLDLFEGNSIVALRTRFTGNLNGDQADIGVVHMGEKVRLVIEGRVRNVTHALDKDERGTRVQSILVDRCFREGTQPEEVW